MPLVRKLTVTPSRVVLCVALVVAGSAIVALVAVALAPRVSTLDGVATHASLERYAMTVGGRSDPHLVTLRGILDEVAAIVDTLVSAERSTVAAGLDDHLRRIASQPSADVFRQFGDRVSVGLAIDDLETALRRVYAAGVRCHVADRGAGTADVLLSEHRRLSLAIVTWRRLAGSAATTGGLHGPLLDLTEQMTRWLKNECGRVLGESIEAAPEWPRAAALVRLGQAAWRREMTRRETR